MISKDCKIYFAYDFSISKLMINHVVIMFVFFFLKWTLRVQENFLSAVWHRTDKGKRFVSPTENLLVPCNQTSQNFFNLCQSWDQHKRLKCWSYPNFTCQDWQDRRFSWTLNTCQVIYGRWSIKTITVANE